MPLNASSAAHTSQPSNAASLPHTRPANEDLEYDSEAETLVGDEPDDDTVPHPGSPTQSQPAAGNATARRLPSDEPCAPTQSNIDAINRSRKTKEMEMAVQRSLSVIPGPECKAKSKSS
ncbi:hypothetical protein BDW02DRAFT_649270 [Decorospora gaudefroyi]|uniref:Uncharacterized protein n=1 Tax=Decorospora gaudefroyi TaxID=184978 RepID=A0A6A5KBN7_9PLEO|nr:hypothetical protein BDW02DRAFT_649270 [Decorospora gaudefroyi]